MTKKTCVYCLGVLLTVLACTLWPCKNTNPNNPGHSPMGDSPGRSVYRMAAQYLSLEPEDFVQGGLISDVDVEFTDVQFCGWDYNGAVQEEILAVKATLRTLDEKGKPDPQSETEQYWSAGGTFSEVGLSDDGYKIIPSATKSGLTKGSNFHHLLASLRSCGMPLGFIGFDLSKIKGMKAHVVRTAVKREGLTNTNRRGDRDNTILTVSKVLSPEPWARAKGAAPAARPVAPAASKGANGAPQPPVQTQAPAPMPQAASDGVDLEALAREAITQALTAEGGMIGDLGTLKVKVFRIHQKSKSDVRNAIVAYSQDSAWLEAQGFGVTDGSVLLPES